MRASSNICRRILGKIPWGIREENSRARNAGGTSDKIHAVISGGIHEGISKWIVCQSVEESLIESENLQKNSCRIFLGILGEISEEVFLGISEAISGETSGRISEKY